ncbi:MAG: phospholipase D-like domain-containing protein [Bacteroidota bacterium]|jgi:phosphatidylserine/phosphatidylglycerophosphate/cardiolipin synthase-like enzyme
MKKIIYILICLWMSFGVTLTLSCFAQETHSVKQASVAPVITSLWYDSIIPHGVRLNWITDTPTDTHLQVAVSDSNYQPFHMFVDLASPNLMTNHSWWLWCPYPGRIYRYFLWSQNTGGTAADSGYFVTQSTSTGKTEVYFTHSVDTTVSTGELANGNANFENLLLNYISKTRYSIDIALWEFSDYPTIAASLISAKNRGVKIRFIYNNSPNTQYMDTLVAHGIQIIHRNTDTASAMHNKFWVFDYRNNSDSSIKWLCTGSANVTHPMFHTDRNNMVFIQDEALCAVYTREFELMWGSHTDIADTSRSKFGPRKFNNVPHVLNVAGTRMEVYFSPVEGVADSLEHIIRTKTTKSLFFGMLKFNLQSMEDTLHSIFRLGRKVCGVVDSTYAFETNGSYPRMKGLAVPKAWSPHADVFIDSIDGLLHHKYFIIDANTKTGNKIISTGSFNWQASDALGNDDNSLTIFDPRVNNLFYQEFMARYRESGGTELWWGVETKDPGQGLLTNYPNPFSRTTRITYVVDKPGWVKLTVLNDTGLELAILAYRYQDPCTCELTWDASGIPAGVYFLRLSTAGVSTVRKMIKIR